MKCPKCGYLGFEPVERCRNCGYDFSLSASSTIPDLSIRSAAPNTIEALIDLPLGESSSTVRRSEPLPAPAPTPELHPGAVTGVGATPELPLFGSAIADDVPLITRPSPPRTPLAVRRATPEVPRLRAETRTAMLDFIPEPDSRASTLRVPAERAERSNNGHRVTPIETDSTSEQEDASLVARVLAVVIDLAVLAAIDVAVVYFTLQISGVTASELAILPKAPLVAFLCFQNISYFVAFTAGGQTLGQMAFGIKVVSEDAGTSPDLSHAVLRTLVWAMLAVPAGLGLMTTVFSNDRRGLHDRFAGTRVVRATA